MVHRRHLGGESASWCANHTCRCQVWGTSSHGRVNWPLGLRCPGGHLPCPPKWKVIFITRPSSPYSCGVCCPLSRGRSLPPKVSWISPTSYKPLMHPPICPCSLFRRDTQHLHPRPHVLILRFVLCSFLTSLPLVEKIHHSGAAGE